MLNFSPYSFYKTRVFVVNALTIFPVEIWRKIFDYSEVEDVKALGATSKLGLELVSGYLNTSLDKDRLEEFRTYRPSRYPQLNLAYSLRNQFGGYKCHYIKVINMEHLSNISIKQLNRFIQFFPNVSTINMPTTLTNVEKLSIDSGWETLSDITYLKTHLHSVNLLQLSSFPALCSLTFKNTNINQQTLENICKVKALENLTIEKPDSLLSDKHLQPLKNLTSLRKFSLINAKAIEEEGFKYLRHLTRLTQLNFAGGTNIKDEALSYFGRLDLESLDLSGCEEITDLGIKRLERIKTLQELNLSNCSRITNASLKSVKSMSELRVLNIAQCAWISDEGFRNLEHLIHLEELTATGLWVLTYHGIAHLDKCIKIKKVVLSECLDLTDQVFNTFQKWPYLKELDLSGCLQLTDAGIANLKYCKNLKVVSLANCPQLTQPTVIDALPPTCVVKF